jgi:hypothetical protein
MKRESTWEMKSSVGKQYENISGRNMARHALHLCLEIGPVANSCEYGNKTSVPTKHGEYLISLSLSSPNALASIS